MSDESLILQENGYLPPGIHNVSLEEMERFFAYTIPDIQQRTQLITGYKQLCGTMEVVFGLHNYTQWIGGSFTTSKEVPNDIDVLTIIDFDEPNTITNDNIEYFLGLTANPLSKELFHCDSYRIMSVPCNHNNYNCYLENKNYWMNQWGHTRPDENGVIHERGFLRLIHGRGAKYE